jgi:pimeloyl-ACP methyl ester carboxylesterase
MPRADSGGLQIDYSDQGHGEPALLLMPGWCSTRDAFGRMTELLAQHRRVLALDWRGHGHSNSAMQDVGSKELLEDALSVIEASSAETVIPVALSHSGWIAIELRRFLRLRIPAIVLLDWIVLDPPQPFLAALHALQDPMRWRQTRDQLFSSWTHDVENPAVSEFVLDKMSVFEFDMWRNAGKSIAAAYDHFGNPLAALKGLKPPVPALHLYAQPTDPAYYEAQKSFAATQPWFKVRRVHAASHFPMLEQPEEISQHIEGFIEQMQSLRIVAV